MVKVDVYNSGKVVGKVKVERMGHYRLTFYLTLPRPRYGERSKV
jgi:hypothetical protein